MRGVFFPFLALALALPLFAFEKDGNCKGKISASPNSVSTLASTSPQIVLKRKLSSDHKTALEKLAGREIKDEIPARPLAPTRGLETSYKMLNAGPEQWVSTGVQSKESQPYQRGLTGSTDAGNYFGDGGVEFYNLMEGTGDKETRSISVFNNEAQATELLETVNRQYLPSSAVMIRGKADPAKMAAGLSDGHKYLSGNSGATVEDVGVFFPSFGHEIEWARSYRSLVEDMARTGFRFEPDSRGAKFFADFEKTEGVLKLKQSEYGLQIVNGDEYEAALRSLFDRWRSQ